MKRLYFLVVGVFALAGAEAQPVHTYNGPEASLSGRVEWAVRSADSNKLDAYWIAYSVMRRMREDSWTGSFRNDWEHLPTLAELLEGTSGEAVIEGSVREAARNALDRIDREGPAPVVDKEVVFMLRFDGDDSAVVDAAVSNIGMKFDFEGAPVFWLRRAKDDESVAQLISHYTDATDTDVQEDLVSAVGMHDTHRLVEPFLENVVESETDDDVRENAVFWLHRNGTDETARYLYRVAESDRSGDIRENAVFALSRMDSGEALDRLIGLARYGTDGDVRENARFWLGQKAGRQIAGDAPEKSGEIPIQKKAVLALAQMDDGAGIDDLIRLVHSHKNPVVRKQALFWLGQSEDERALDAIVAILKSDS